MAQGNKFKSENPDRWACGDSLKARLESALAQRVRSWGLPQREAGEKIDMPQSALGRMLRGKELLSIDKLLYHCGLAGINVTVEIE